MAQWYRNIQDIITIIDDCIRAQQDEALTLRALAQKLGYSEYYTSRKFRELAGMTLRDYLRLRRLAFALRDVRDTLPCSTVFPPMRLSRTRSKKPTA